MKDMKDIIKDFEDEHGFKFIGHFGDGLFFIDNIGCPFFDDCIAIYAPGEEYGFTSVLVEHPEWWGRHFSELGFHLSEKDQKRLLKAAISAMNKRDKEMKTA